MSLKIKVFYAESDNWKHFPETSKYLTDKQLVPNAGDSLTLCGRDGIDILQLESTDIKHILTVKRKLYNYASCDVAILLHYTAW